MLVTNTTGYPLWDIIFTLTAIVSVPVTILAFKFWPWLHYQWLIRTFTEVSEIVEDVAVICPPIDLFNGRYGSLLKRVECRNLQITSVVVSGKLYTLKDRVQTIQYQAATNHPWSQLVCIQQLADICVGDRTVACVIKFKIENGRYELLSIKCDYPIERYNIVYQLNRIK
jgi:hypothetical protein